MAERKLERLRSSRRRNEAFDRLALVIGTLAAGVLVEDQHRRVALATRELCRIFRIPSPPESMVGTDFSETAQQAKEFLAEPDAFPARIEEIIAGGRPIRDETVLFADGRIFERDYTPLEIGGEPAGHLWVYRDVTAQRAEAAEVARSDRASTDLLALATDRRPAFAQRVESLLESGCELLGLPVGVVTRLAEGRDEVVAARDHQGRLRTGMRLPADSLSLPGLSDHRGAVVLEAPGGYRPVGASYLSSIGFSVGIALRARGHVWGTLAFGGEEPRSRPFSERELNVIGLMGQWLEAEEERQRATSDLRRSRARAVATIEGAIDAVITIGADERVIEFNPAAERMFGLRRAEVLGRTLAELIIPPELRAAHHQGIARYLQTRRPVALGRRLELPALHASGSRFLVELSVTAIESEGEVIAFTAYLRDISERKRAEAELFAARDEALEATRLKSQYLTTISHELRTPASGIIGALDLLGELDLNSRQRELVEVAEGSADALLRILNDLLDAAKIEAHGLALVDQEFDLLDTIESAVEASAPSARAKDLTLAAAVDPALASSVRGDPLRVRQILVNLLGNAVKFTETGEVVLRAWLAARDAHGITVSISIADTGPGIPHEQQQALFRPFSQADSGLSARHGGTGLGLVISRELARLMGGDIGLESEPGHGTVMTVTLRLAEVARPQEETGPLAGRRVLVAGSRRGVVDALRAQLESLGATVETASSRLETQRLAGALGAEVALVDWELATVLPTPLPVMTISGPMSGSVPALQLPVRRRRLAELILAAIAGGAETMRPASETADQHQAPAAAPMPMAAGDVLVAEDVDVNRELICRQLEGLGYRARPARDGEEAVAAAQEGGLALILMDMRMPGLDGIEATKRIRALEPPGVRTPIVAITANATEEDRRACLDAGMDDHLPKPVRSATLRVMLDRWIAPAETIVAIPAPGIPQAAAPNGLEAALAELSRDLAGEVAVSALIDRWREELGGRLDALRTAVETGDEGERRRIAHALKGASGIFAIRGLTERCAALETASEPAAAALLLDDVEAEAEALDAALAEWQARHPIPDR